jgi:protein disulfide-isomerase
MGLAAICAIVLGGCGRGDAASAPPVPAKPAASSLASVHADAPGIAWFDGDVNAAFASAKVSNKPVLLYWGAQWCPPVQAAQVGGVQSSGLHREVETLRRRCISMAICPTRRSSAMRFACHRAIPPSSVFKPDRTEITRIAGNMDLSLYAGVLDNVLGDVRPVKDVIEIAAKGGGPMAA